MNSPDNTRLTSKTHQFSFSLREINNALRGHNNHVLVIECNENTGRFEDAYVQKMSQGDDMVRPEVLPCDCNK